LDLLIFVRIGLCMWCRYVGEILAFRWLWAAKVKREHNNLAWVCFIFLLM